MPQQPSVLSSGIFLLIAVLAFAYHILNGDIDGSGLLFFMMTAPWGWALPNAVIMSDYWHALAYPVAWLMIVANTATIGIAVHYWYDRRRPDHKDVGIDSTN